MAQSKACMNSKSLATIIDDIIIEFYDGALNEYRKISKNTDDSAMTQKDVADILQLTDDKFISKIERSIQKMDDRTFTIFLLLTGNHPKYRLVPTSKKKQSKDKENKSKGLFLPSPDPSLVSEYRANIDGLSSSALAGFLGLHSGMVRRYESEGNSQRSPSSYTWVLLLLITGQHPNYKLEKK